MLSHCLCYSELLQYLSNSALAYTSVASTTVLTSTSGLFTLFFGALIGQDSVNAAKITAVLISMAGVAMTTVGKTWAPDEMLSLTEWVRLVFLVSIMLQEHRNYNLNCFNFIVFARTRRHSITGDIFGLLSAASYGLFTGIPIPPKCCFGFSMDYLLWQMCHTNLYSASQAISWIGRWQGWCSKVLRIYRPLHFVWPLVAW